MRTIERCRACASSELHEVMSFGTIHLSAFIDRAGSKPPKYPLDLVLCSRCKLLQLRHTVPANAMYENYWYRSGTNASMTRELADIARVARRYLVPGDTVLDIGCNDGTLLRAYQKDTYDPPLRCVGFEPATNLVPYAAEGGAQVVNDFFNAEAWREHVGDVRAAVVTSIAMFYDLDDPNSFVEDVKAVMAHDGVWIIQMADLKSMLDRTMWDNVCHEHLEYYSLCSLKNLLVAHGLSVVDLERNDVNGGSVRVMVQRADARASWSVERLEEDERTDSLDTMAPYAAFKRRVYEETTKLVSFVEVAVREGKSVYVYGASTKGNTLLQVAGLDHRHIVAAAERNPDKWGKRTVGTNIPIVSEEEARAAKPDYFLVLPWHFLDEFVERERAYLSAGGKFIVPLPEFRVLSQSAL